MQALLAAAKAESSASVRRAFAQATAQVAKHAAEPRVAKLFADIADMYRQRKRLAGHRVLRL